MSALFQKGSLDARTRQGPREAWPGSPPAAAALLSAALHSGTWLPAGRPEWGRAGTTLPVPFVLYSAAWSLRAASLGLMSRNGALPSPIDTTSCILSSEKKNVGPFSKQLLGFNTTLDGIGFNTTLDGISSDPAPQSNVGGPRGLTVASLRDYGVTGTSRSHMAMRRTH